MRARCAGAARGRGARAGAAPAPETGPAPRRPVAARAPSPEPAPPRGPPPPGACARAPRAPAPPRRPGPAAPRSPARRRARPPPRPRRRRAPRARSPDAPAAAGLDAAPVAGGARRHLVDLAGRALELGPAHVGRRIHAPHEVAHLAHRRRVGAGVRGLDSAPGLVEELAHLALLDLDRAVALARDRALSVAHVGLPELPEQRGPLGVALVDRGREPAHVRVGGARDRPRLADGRDRGRALVA